jgi:hypothetical protein
MSRPGVEVTSSASAPAAGVPTDTGVGFLVNEFAQGPTDRPTRVTSLDELTATYGPRLAAWPYGYDGADVYFHEGGGVLYVQRITDSDAAAATGDLSAVTGAAATANAANAGEWGNGLVVEVVATPGGNGVGTRSSKGKSNGPQQASLLTYDTLAGPGANMATVSLDGSIVQTSVPIDTVQDLVDFLNSGEYVVVSNVANPTDALVVGTAPFTGGVDGTVPASGADSLPNALAAMVKELGPGQVFAPGHSSVEDHGAILAHCAGANRVALLDGARTDGPQELSAGATALRGAQEDRYGSLWGPWAVAPGLALGTTRVVPWSAVQAALCARVDRAGNPNQAAAGQWGECQYITDLDQTFTPDECEALLYAGVDTARNVYGEIQAYAYRTLADPAGPRAEWRELNWSRLNMALVAEGTAVAQDYVFSQLDGRGHTIAAFGGGLTGICVKYYAMDALFGDDPTEAFAVNVGPQVNTIDKLADGILSAVLLVRMSPHAELVRVDIVKESVTVALA